jgi:hypothetical protein
MGGGATGLRSSLARTHSYVCVGSHCPPAPWPTPEVHGGLQDSQESLLVHSVGRRTVPHRHARLRLLLPLHPHTAYSHGLPGCCSSYGVLQRIMHSVLWKHISSPLSHMKTRFPNSSCSRTGLDRRIRTKNRFADLNGCLNPSFHFCDKQSGLSGQYRACMSRDIPMPRQGSLLVSGHGPATHIPKSA